MARKKHGDVEESLRRLEAERGRREIADIKFAEFNFSIDVRLAVEKHADTISLLHRLHYFNGVVECTDNGSTEIPASLFKDEHTLERFATIVNQTFVAFLPTALHDETVLHLSDVIHFVINKLEIETVDLRDQAKIHGQQTQKAVLRRFGIQRAGRAPQWQKSELSRAVLAALRTLPKREHTYRGVAARLKSQYGEKAPKSGDSLRKMVEGFGLDWQALKNGRR